ncbi:MAG: hypothetical protein LBV18_02180 [Alistipes sp.]|nr:hypothetical protein [Alistipes sp.]
MERLTRGRPQKEGVADERAAAAKKGEADEKVATKKGRGLGGVSLPCSINFLH